MHRVKNYLLIPFVLLINFLMAQNYQAINGSSYAGSLGTGNNPSSIVHVPYAWDITPFSVQLKQSTNAFKIEKYSFLSSPVNAAVRPENGIKKRFAFANQDIHLLNARVNISAKSAIAFGANIRNYIYATTRKSNYQDSSFSLADFMKINIDHLPLSGEFTGAAWAEVYATYAQIIIDDGERLLNAGLSLKINRGLAGGYIKAQGVSYVPTSTPVREGYLLTNGSLQFGYSSNFDAIDSNKTGSANRKIFLQKTYSSLSADIGFEYILLSGDDKAAGSDFAYDTKIGISVMDIGRNKYLHARRSRLAIAGLPGITDTLIESKFSTVATLDNFNDNLATISDSLNETQGAFYISGPTRLMINIDQHLIYNFFINGEITLPILSLLGKKTLFIRDLNLLAITPRWEIKSLGAYFPILFNTRKQLWIGGAFKAGPVLFGTHNLGSLFSKNRSHAGGLYLALTIRPGKNFDSKSNYSKDKLSRKDRRSLNCPKF